MNIEYHDGCRHLLAGTEECSVDPVDLVVDLQYEHERHTHTSMPRPRAAYKESNTLIVASHHTKQLVELPR